MQKKYVALLLMLLLFTATLAGCSKPAQETPVAAAPEGTAELVTLTVTGGWADCLALDVVARAFNAQYPECTIVYEYLQDYYPSLEKRMSGDEPIDLFVTSNIQADSPQLPYAKDLYACEGLDLSQTFDGLIQNFEFREKTGENTQLYAIPLGAEMRGLYVNKTLLDSLGIAVPTNQATLLEACQKLKEGGYIAFHGNPGAFAQTLIYPWICNLIANAEDPKAAYDRVNAHEPGVSEMFREPYAFLYTLVERGYYDYKKAQTDLELFTETTDESYARDFLNIRKQGEEWVKADDVGRVAFMPAPMSLESIIAKTKEDYHSEIEYVFLPSPVGKDGGFAYLSPAHGIAMCNKSNNPEWAEKFLNFLFQPENNKVFAEAFHIIPNTKEAFSYIRTLFDVPDDRISHLGQVTFDYGFYEIIHPTMVDLSKGNNPKYMRDDGTGNLSLYPLDYYMEELETALVQQ